MPENDKESRKSQDRPEGAAKKPGAPAKAKSATREARLADALRDNLRRRKAGPSAQKTDRKED